MKVKELREILNAMAEFPRHDDDEVGVVIKKTVMGSTPTIKVRSARSGFDWNHGKFMIWCEKDMIDLDSVKEQNK